MSITPFPYHLGSGAYLSEHEQRIIHYTVPITGTLGIIGALSTILGYSFIPTLRTTLSRLVLCMAFADLVAVTAKTIGRAGPDRGALSPLCQAQGAFMSWGDVSSVLWTATISFNLLMVMCFRKTVETVKSWERWYILICYLVPIPFAVAPLFLGDHDPVSGRYFPMYGEADLWCWISPKFPLARTLLFYALLWTIFLGNFFIYLFVGRILWRQTASVQRHRARGISEQKRFIYGKNTSLYVLIYLITWAPSTIFRAHSLFFPNASPIFGLALAMAIISPIRGLTSAIVYFFVSWRTRPPPPFSQNAPSTRILPSDSEGQPRTPRDMESEPSGAIEGMEPDAQQKESPDSNRRWTIRI
ncbi:hypothetical protein BJ684DRAFT_15628 [Piptocephalis cylindrospora]|uniref:G-protein coupled receptors family 2 profile 2 domain-containing protein n=1 Tax=Piptocephalis cylindrospora TaxID=1907219 RepID=A0A4P9Y7U9_9FUNG|nr:hypothetical protein BJ684DRAFT_15628 [Piptocephalis cylindrospora]|eukprot:RKP14020.1 hypothetical protein BJ684DRAFT_15628 [Piptocephalis cylindrospora]